MGKFSQDENLFYIAGEDGRVRYLDWTANELPKKDKILIE